MDEEKQWDVIDRIIDTVGEILEDMAKTHPEGQSMPASLVIIGALEYAKAKLTKALLGGEDGDDEEE